MKSIALLNQKGGSGKTTIAVHVAVAAEEHERVVVIDTDPQQSASAWSRARSQPSPFVVTADVSDLRPVIDAASQDGMTLAVVDSAPHAAPPAAMIARAVDLVVIPVRPSAFDIAAAERAVDLVKAAGVAGVFVLSACPARAPEINETRQVLAEYELPIAPVDIIDRRAYARAVATGQSVTEFDGESKAAAEIRALWSWLRAQLYCL